VYTQWAPGVSGIPVRANLQCINLVANTCPATYLISLMSLGISDRRIPSLIDND
jgi:hypothetical protein